MQQICYVDKSNDELNKCSKIGTKIFIFDLGYCTQIIDADMPLFYVDV